MSSLPPADAFAGVMLQHGQNLFLLWTNRSRCCRPQDAAEGGTLHVAGRTAGGGVPEAVARVGQFADGPVQFLRLGQEHLPVDAGPPVWREHERDLIEREAGGAPHRDQRQPLQHTGIEHTMQTVPASRQTLLSISDNFRGVVPMLPARFCRPASPASQCERARSLRG
jgi:hypothetical protein